MSTQAQTPNDAAGQLIPPALTAFLEKLRSDLNSAIDAAKNEASSAVSSLRSDFTSLVSRIGSLETQGSSLISRIGSLEDKAKQAVESFTSDEVQELRDLVAGQKLHLEEIKTKLDLTFERLEKHGIAIMQDIEAVFSPKPPEGEIQSGATSSGAGG